ncbi:MAG: TolC family protein [Kofleriaceae bacterium]
MRAQGAPAPASVPTAAAEVRASSAARPVTLASAIEAALANNPQLAIQAESVVAADARTRADSARRFPALGVRGNVFVWDQVIEVQFGDAKIPIRERVTGNVDVVISQPLSALGAIGKLVARDRAVADAGRARRDELRVEIAYQTAAAYLGALQAQTLAQVAAGTQQQLEADLQQAKILVRGGALPQVDVLRLEVERARAEQQRLQSESAALGARRALASLLGLPDGTELTLVEIDASAPPLGVTEDEAVAQARRDRAQARVADADRTAADLGVAVARASYFPSVSLQAIYSHAINAGSFGSANSGYLGVSFDWNLWDWGQRGAEVDGARALSRQARLSQANVMDQVAVDTRARWQAAHTARATLEVTDRGLAAATEAQRLQSVRFAQGAATTTEVVDAEAALANASAQAVIARYQYLVTWMALSRAMGQLPTAPAGR